MFLAYPGPRPSTRQGAQTTRAPSLPLRCTVRWIPPAPGPRREAAGPVGGRPNWLKANAERKSEMLRLSVRWHTQAVIQSTNDPTCVCTRAGWHGHMAKGEPWIARATATLTRKCSASLLANCLLISRCPAGYCSRFPAKRSPPDGLLQAIGFHQIGKHFLRRLLFDIDVVVFPRLHEFEHDFEQSLPCSLFCLRALGRPSRLIRRVNCAAMKTAKWRRTAKIIRNHTSGGRPTSSWSAAPATLAGQQLLKMSPARFRIQDIQDLSSVIRQGRSDPGSSPCSRPPQSRARTTAASRCTHRLPRRRGAVSSSRRRDRRWCLST